MSKVTINTLQKNTQQVIPGYWKITLTDSAQTVTSIVKLTADAYCVTHDMTEHKTFTAALTHVLPLYQAAQSVTNVSVMAQSARRAMMVALLGVASVGTAQATNVDVNAFLVKAQTALDHADRKDLYNEAVNAFDNLNARDRMVVAGIADKTNNEGMIRDVIGSAESRGHQAVVPQGWNIEKTQDFLRAAHPVASAPAPTARMAPAPAATFDPVAHANANANAALHMIQNTDNAVVQNQKDIAAVQHSADHANTNANAALHMLQKTDSAVVQNQKDIAVVQNDVIAVDQRIDSDGQRIDRNAKRIDETREDLKRGLNNAAAMTGLHYHSNDAYALSVGTANGEGAALAGGLSHGFTQHTAATVQASTSMDGGYMASVGFSGDF